MLHSSYQYITKKSKAVRSLRHSSCDCNLQCNCSFPLAAVSELAKKYRQDTYIAAHYAYLTLIVTCNNSYGLLKLGLGQGCAASLPPLLVTLRGRFKTLTKWVCNVKVWSGQSQRQLWFHKIFRNWTCCISCLFFIGESWQSSKRTLILGLGNSEIVKQHRVIMHGTHKEQISYRGTRFLIISLNTQTCLVFLI